MDEVYLENVKIRQKRLQDTVQRAKTSLETAQVGIPKDEFTAICVSLKNNLNNFSKELAFYMEKSKNPDIVMIRSFYEDQMKAEDIMTELDILESNSDKLEDVTIQQRARLPKLELGKYSGNILEWTSFWEKFELNVHKRNITDNEKLSYLLGALEGIAYQAIEGLGPSNLNYPIAIDILMKRFGGPQRVIDAHNKALNTLKQADATASDCRLTLNIIEKHLRVLEGMGENTDSSHLRVIILAKFPENILYQVNLLTAEDASIKSIRKALDIVVSALENSDFRQPPVKTSCTTEVLHTTSRENIPKKRKLPSYKYKSTFTDKQNINEPMEKRKKFKCDFCEMECQHYSEDCQEYQTYQERKAKLKDKCYICFKRGHRASKCFSKRKCRHCRKRHHRVLCPMKTKSKNIVIDINNEKEMSVTLTNKSSNFLQTAIVKIVTAKSSNLLCRLLLDSGSQRSYITARLAKKLQITPDKEDNLIIYTFGCDKPKEILSPSIEITLITKRKIERTIRVNIVSHITDRIPLVSINNITTIDILADDNSAGTTIDLLIGNDLYFSFMRSGHFKVKDHLYCIDTDFGWILTGNMVEQNECDTLSVMTYCQCHEANCPYFNEPDLPLRSIDISFLWTLESIGIVDSPKANREEEAVKNFNETTRYVKGRYEVKWPWIQFPPDLPSNYGLALGRLKGLIKRSDKETLVEYNRILEEQLAANIIEIVDHTSNTGEDCHPIHYLPHHMVKQTGKRGRIVYDASAKLKNQKSLNECLYRGPSMLEDLTGLLLQFRQGKIGITADVEKAFLQVGLQTEDRDVTRFLWVEDIERNLTEDNLVCFRFCRVPFGIISSPFLLTAAIRYHMTRINDSLVHKIADKCYVDNLVTSAKSIEEAIYLQEETTKVFHDLSMNIRDWISNSEDFMKKVPQEIRAKEKATEKVLGLLWNLSEDTLQLKFNVDNLQNEDEEQKITKREVLSTLARLYDPCGFVSPLVLPAKLLFQELCTRKLKWEQTLPEDLHSSWIETLEGLISAKDVKIPRHFGFDENCEFELHGFTDASKNAYAAVTYLRLICNGKIKTAFLISKSRVTPVSAKNDLKIPKLELLGCLIGARLLKYVKAQLKISLSKIYLWTDSQIVLAWIKSNKLLPPFVLKRVNEIKQIKDSLGIELCYVNTKENPADIATKPEMWLQKQKLWFNGPSFLAEKDNMWPKLKQLNEDEVICLAGEDLDTIGSPENTEMMDQLQQSKDRVNNTEVSESNLDTVKRLQKKYFPEEVKGKETHLTRNLGLYMDVDGILRSKGRLSNTNWTYEMKHPILIPKDSTFTNDLIERVHKENYHVGTSHTLSILRRPYWIPQGRVQVQKILRKCPQCVKYGGGPFKLPPAPALPVERVNYSTPFTFTGVDYLGPILVKVNNITEKRWICLLTCLAVRAIHLELVKDLTAEECLLALRRFMATRCTPLLFVSDNALQFKLTSEVLTSQYCMERNIKWKFITQLAPWQGGFYERLVALVKHCMKRTLEKHLLSDNQLQTVVKEIQFVINTRPLTSVGSELEEVLRPADFLTLGKCIELSPTFKDSLTEGTNTKIDLIKGWKRGHMIVTEYKNMFINQYLPSLRERYSHIYKQPRVKSYKIPEVGNIVQIKDDSKTRTNWKVGKIIALMRGQDGECRAAKVKVGNSEYTRSLVHLYPLEAESYDSTIQPNICHQSEDLTPTIEAEEPNSSLLENPTIENLQEMSNERVNTPRPEISAEDSTIEPVEESPEQSVPKFVSSEEISSLDTPCNSLLPPEEVEAVEVSEEKSTAGMNDNTEMSNKRKAAIRAREKITEWTRQLLSLM